MRTDVKLPGASVRAAVYLHPNLNDAGAQRGRVHPHRGQAHRYQSGSRSVGRSPLLAHRSSGRCCSMSPSRIRSLRHERRSQHTPHGSSESMATRSRNDARRRGSLIVSRFLLTIPVRLCPQRTLAARPGLGASRDDGRASSGLSDPSASSGPSSHHPSPPDRCAQASPVRSPASREAR